MLAVELAWADENTDSEPYCIVRADSNLLRHDEGTVKCTSKDDKTWMGSLRRGDYYFMATKLEPISHGSNICTLSKKQFWVFPTDVRVVDVELAEQNNNRSTRNSVPKLVLALKSKEEILSNLSIDKLEERVN